jgi:Type I restriction-modification system methyltransferase subunit
MLLDQATEKLGWPDRRDVMKPSGEGNRVLAELAQEKIGLPLKREGAQVEVGILSPSPSGTDTEAPLAIVCEFSKRPSDRLYALAHRLAWNFSRTRLLITAERDRLLAWTCCKPPTVDLKDKLAFNDSSAFGGEKSIPTLSQTATNALHWVNLITGEFFRQRANQFRTEERADALLLENLRFVRAALLDAKLPKDVCHDLLARLIFVQFLFHRKDTSGKPFLDDPLMQSRLEGQLSRPHANLESILTDRDDTYALFQWLNGKFNGDLFPGKGGSAAAREREWEEEKDQVKKRHLELLADFVSGRMKMDSRQPTLWREYSFDTIPLEFISSVYEQFISEDAERDKAYYTPAHLVDFVLDGVLPWESKEWDLQILDPACGSGIFLVKAFQRLVHRWKKANHGKAPKVPDLKPILEDNLFGVDINRDAVRVASFSLYLAMCDAIDPRHYWKQVVFPRLRDRRLMAKDFFLETEAGFRTKEDSESFDIVLGNAPWGKNSIKRSRDASAWAVKHEWPVTYGDIGPLFPAKAAKLTKLGGTVTMLQPATVLLFNRSKPALAARRKLFESVTVEEVVNLSALRFELFNNAVSPACLLTFKNEKRGDEAKLEYICPKPQKTSEDQYRVVIEPQDIHTMPIVDAANDPFVWTALTWGSRRDLELLKRLRRNPNLEKYRVERKIQTGEGIIRGTTPKSYAWIVGRRIQEEREFPPNTFLHLNPTLLPVNQNPKAHRPPRREIFRSPQLLIKQSWIVGVGRFQGAIVDAPPGDEGIICSDSYVSVHAPAERHEILEAAWLAQNSKWATYYQLLTSGRFAAFIPQPLEDELRSLPLPEPRPGILEGIKTMADVDNRIRELLGFKQSEWALIEDLFEFTLPDFKGDARSPGRQPTLRKPQDNDPVAEIDLQQYATQFTRVLKAGFGDEKQVCATVFQEPAAQRLPVRLLAIHLHWPNHKPIEIESMQSDVLLQRLAKLYADSMKAPDKGSGFYFERSARIYAAHPTSQGKIPTVFLIKPDQRRQWTRSMAMRDADEVAAEIVLAKWR